VTPANSVINHEVGCEIASRLEAEHPLWIVVFGVFTKQFVCFPKFEAPRGTMLTAMYPDALPDRMRRAEEAICKARPRGANSPRPRRVAA
jgi:hypothetical protein